MENILKKGLNKYLEHFANQRISVEGQTLDGKKHGIWTFYHDNGIKASSGLFVDGLKEGKWQWYNPQGKLIEKTMCKKDLYHGVSIRYYAHGVLKDVRMFEEGDIKAIISTYDESGNLIKSP